MRFEIVPAMAFGLALSACAGRDPQSIATVLAQDTLCRPHQIRACIDGM
jgi:hypothetical protein